MSGGGQTPLIAEVASGHQKGSIIMDFTALTMKFLKTAEPTGSGLR
jgi:hypothetical protein